MVKDFVLDTNVLLHDAGSIGVFADNNIVIPIPVIEELDKFKRNQDQLGRNARQVIRSLDKLRANGKLAEGVPLSSIGLNASGRLFVTYATDLAHPGLQQLFDAESQRSADNRILAVALQLQKTGRPVVFISKDINMRLKADALGLKVMDFEREKVHYDALYRGFQEIGVTAAQMSELHREKLLALPEVKLYPNEFALLRRDDKSALTRNAGNRTVRLIESPDGYRIWNIAPRNKEQRMALELLMDPEVKLVSLVGGAGTGKTLLALAAALECTLNSGEYERILVSRPIIPMGNDIGYMPGGKDDKLRNWMQPIFDNLDFLLGEPSSPNKNKPAKSGSVNQKIQNLINSTQLELEALTYIRGRSIAKQYIVVDEAQNLTPHEVKTIISRAGEGTKIVLTGDPEQIDNPYLDAAGNGLSYLVERLKDQAIFGHVTLKKSERSDLAGIAARVL